MAFVTPPLALGAPAFTDVGAKTGGHIPVLLVALYVVIAAGLVVALIWSSVRQSPPDPDPGDGHGRGRGPKRPAPESPRGPRGGIPLNDAVPARVRLRSAVRLGDALPPRHRRQVREPGRRPVRVRTPA